LGFAKSTRYGVFYEKGVVFGHIDEKNENEISKFDTDVVKITT